MSIESPKVSIGLPVYNGEKYIRYTMDSLLAQTFTDFEIIVCDNASTDSTPKIIAEYMAKDARIRYYRAPVNRGPAPNYNWCVELARAPFFKWQAADDLCEPTFVEKCLKVIENDPSVVMAYTGTKIINSKNEFVTNYTYESDLASYKPADRLRNLVFVDHKMHGAHEFWGIVRTADIKRAGMKRQHVRADSILLVRYALLGRLVRIKEPLFINRDHNDRSSKYLSTKKVRPGSWLSGVLGCGPTPSAEWWDSSLKGKIVYPEWRVLQEYSRSVEDMPLSPADRAACRAVIRQFAFWHIPKMTRDVLIATEQHVNKLLGRFPDPNAPAKPAAPAASAKTQAPVIAATTPPAGPTANAH